MRGGETLGVYILDGEYEHIFHNIVIISSRKCSLDVTSLQIEIRENNFLIFYYT